MCFHEVMKQQLGVVRVTTDVSVKLRNTVSFHQYKLKEVTQYEQGQTLICRQKHDIEVTPTLLK